MNISDKPESPLVQRPNKELVVSVVTKRAPGAIDAAGERGFGNDPAIPDRLDQFVLADDTVMVAHEVNDEIEYLGLDMHGFAQPAQLMLTEIDFIFGESVLQYHLCCSDARQVRPLSGGSRIQTK
nr:hypothetical protein [Bradyrhizobium paxllaeri]